MASPEFGYITLEVVPAVKHATQATGADDATFQMSVDEWNEAHDIDPIPVMTIEPRKIWPSMPASLTEFLGGTEFRQIRDLSNGATVYLTAHVLIPGGATPAKLRGQYSDDGGSTWYYLDGASGPSVDINTLGHKRSAGVALAAGAKAEVLLRIAGIDG